MNVHIVWQSARVSMVEVIYGGPSISFFLHWHSAKHGGPFVLKWWAFHFLLIGIKWRAYSFSYVAIHKDIKWRACLILTVGT